MTFKRWDLWDLMGSLGHLRDGISERWRSQRSWRMRPLMCHSLKRESREGVGFCGVPVGYANGAAQLECIKMKARLQKEMKREREGERQT